MKNIKIILTLIVLALSSFGLTNQPALNQIIINPYLPKDGFVGQIKGSEAFVAIVTTGRETLAYVCDGVETAEWFRGFMLESGWLELTSKRGWKLRASMSTSSAIGSLIIKDDKPMTFIARPVEGNAGLYRAESITEGIKYVGGWIVNTNGEQRGAVIGGGTFQSVPYIDIVTFQVEVVGLGALVAQSINPDYVETFMNP